MCRMLRCIVRYSMAWSNKSEGVNSVLSGTSRWVRAEHTIWWGPICIPADLKCDHWQQLYGFKPCRAWDRIVDGRNLHFYEQLMVLALAAPFHGPIYLFPAARHTVIANPGETGRFGGDITPLPWEKKAGVELSPAGIDGISRSNIC